MRSPAEPGGRLSTGALQFLLDELVARDVDVCELLARCGLTEPQVRDAEAVPAVQGLKLIRLATEATREPALGLYAGRRNNFAALGVQGVAIRSSPDAGTAVRTMPQLGNSFPFVSFEFLAGGGAAVVLTEELGPHTPRLLHDFFSASVLSVGASVIGGFTPVRVEYACSQPADVTPYEELFDCPLLFDRPRTQVQVPWGAPTAEMPHRDDVVHQAVLPHAVKAAAVPSPDPVGEPDVASRARGLLLSGGDSRILSIHELAERLTMSPRTLRRHLQRAGTGYLALLDEARQELVLQDLVNRPELSGAQIARRLGYTDPPTFYRAFQRWTGTTFSAYRDRLRADA